ncbi:MAG: hypothetical protein ABW202_17125 [Duganella sp.]
MNTTIFNHHTNANFADDVINAVRKLFASLFSKKPAAVAVEEEMVAERASDETIWWLSSTAKDVEAHSPSLAAELRYAASRA